MIHLLDGPAIGAKLSPQRLPVFLRVVVDADGSIDALDQLDDTPTESESIHVYRMLPETFSSVLSCSRGRGGRGCQSFCSADYRLHENQPADDIARDIARWQKWVLSEAENTIILSCPKQPANTP